MKILFLATSSRKKGEIDEPTGAWYEELAAPYNHFVGLGYEVVLSSVEGGEIPIDPGSLEDGMRTADVDAFLQNEEAVAKLKSSRPAKEVTMDGFDAIFVPGGLGVMYDMPDNPDVGRILSDAWKRGCIVGAVCHGPAALFGAKDIDGGPLIKGRRITGFTNSEEEATGHTEKVPYLLEDKAKEQGALFERVDDWAPFAIADGKLITGQNPASSKRVAELMTEALTK